MKLFLDIETLPTNDQAIIDEMAKTITAPANYSKPESIQKWMDENFASALKDKVARTSFDGLFGRVCVICASFEDGQVEAFANNNEAQLLTEFYSYVADCTGIEHHRGTAFQDLTVVGHNVASFDLPFLKHRSIINGICPPAPLLKAMNAKAWDSVIADTMLMWSSDRERRASMDKLCKAFGIPSKGDFDGSMVADTWPNDPQKVIDYCKADVERTRQIYKRLTFQTTAEIKLAA